MIPEFTGESRSWTRFQQSPASAEPSPASRVSGLLAEIRSTIRTEPFTDHYTVIPGRELGRGKFAVVRRCVEKLTGLEFAAKFMRKRRKGQDCRMEIISEIAVLELATSSPRVVNLHRVYEMAFEMVLVLEYAAGGEIFHQCVLEQQDEVFSEEDVKRLMRQILEGVAFLHRHSVVHLDLKPQNILLSSSCPLGDIKIVDFGLSRNINSRHELREILGTPEYVAPEILSYEPISTATDIWSVGVLTYVMLTGISPFLGDDKQETFLNISQLNVSYGLEELQRLDPAAVTFIQALLRRQPRAGHRRAVPQTPLALVPRVLGGTVRMGAPSSCTGTKDKKTAKELVVMETYTLGQSHQSASSKETLSPEQEAECKCFRFQGPFSRLQEAPGDFIYCPHPGRRAGAVIC